MVSDDGIGHHVYMGTNEGAWSNFCSFGNSRRRMYESEKSLEWDHELLNFGCSMKALFNLEQRCYKEYIFLGKELWSILKLEDPLKRKQ
jgi:hypothetical protein